MCASFTSTIPLHRNAAGAIEDVTPEASSGFNVRTRVHEYGGDWSGSEGLLHSPRRKHVGYIPVRNIPYACAKHHCLLLHVASESFDIYCASLNSLEVIAAGGEYVLGKDAVYFSNFKCAQHSLITIWSVPPSGTWGSAELLTHVESSSVQMLRVYGQSFHALRLAASAFCAAFEYNRSISNA